MGTLIIDYKYRGYTFEDVYLIVTKSSYNTHYEKRIHKSPVNKRVIVAGNLFVEYNGVTRNIKIEGRSVKTVSSFEVYFDINDLNVPLIFGFVEDNGNKEYYSCSELFEKEKPNFQISDENIQIELYSITKIEATDLDSRLKQEKDKNTVFLCVHEITSYKNVDVDSELHDLKNTPFKKYNHKPSKNGDKIRYELMLCEDKCKVQGYNPRDYLNKKIEVVVYFHNIDEENKVPLLIEVINERESSNEYFELSDIHDVTHEFKYTYKGYQVKENSKTYVKIFTKCKKPENLLKKLTEIYNNSTFSYKIYDILGNDNSTVIKAVSGSVGTISAIGTGVGGFFIYKNSALVISFFKSLF